AGGGRRARDRGHRGRRDRRPDPETLRRGARARRRSRDRTPRRRRRRLAEPRLRRRGRRPGRRGRARPSQGRPAPRDVPRRADADDSGARERVLPARRRDRCRGPDPARTPDGARPAGDGSTGRPARSSGSALSRALLNEMDQLPYVDLPRQHAVLKTELLQAIGRVLDHAQFVLGEEVAEFERRFAALCTVTYAIGVNSGTDALVLALSALDVGPGDEVITVPNSFVATTSAIRLLGARPVFVDVRDDLNIDPDRLEAAIGPATKAILPVHLTGRPCDMAAILAVAERRGVAVVEDCAQAVGAEYAGRRVGSFGRLGCFSLHPLKNLNACGDGGVVTTDDAELAGRVRNLRDLGRIGRDDCGTWAGNSRLDTMQAAILLVKLEHLDRWTVRRREIAAQYRRALADLAAVRLPDEQPAERAVYHTFVIEAERRDELRAFLGARGVGSAVHYPLPIHLTTAGQELGYPPGSFPVAEGQAARILSLPIYPELTGAEVERVCATIRAFYEGGA